MGVRNEFSEGRWGEKKEEEKEGDIDRGDYVDRK